MKKTGKIQPVNQEKVFDKSKLRNFLYIIAIVEGASVMAIELAGAKMIAPFYGTSLYVWAAVLAVTLGGLTTGYFLGGWATYRYQPQKILVAILTLSTIFITLMPLIALRIMPATHGLGLRAGALVSSVLIMFLPLICMGMVSPTIIQISNTELKGTGKTAGTIYAISTVGGIAMTLLMGFYLLPNWGIKNSVYLTAFLMGSMSLMLVFVLGKLKMWSSLGLIIATFICISSMKPFTDPKSPIKYLYRSEGILGQLAVFQNSSQAFNEPVRLLFINQIPQTYVSLSKLSTSLWDYPHRLATIASIKPPKSKVLLIGMGGGSMESEFRQLGYDMDIVEIDGRIPELAKKYFGFNPVGVNLFVDDGRHFIKNTKNKYDIIIFDVVNGENQPFHLFTEESFKELKNIFKDDGLFLVNFQGDLFDEHGSAARSILKTLKDSGFIVKYYDGAEKGTGNDLHFIASLIPKDFHTISEDRINQCCKGFPHTYKDLFTEKEVDLSDAELLVDNKPRFETFNNYNNEQWRIKTMANLVEVLGELKMPFFH